jgi:hypothetical protein
MITNLTEILQYAFNTLPLDGLEDCDAVCAISGAPIKQGYPIKKIISKDTAEIADIMREGRKW